MNNNIAAHISDLTFYDYIVHTKPGVHYYNTNW